MSSPDERKICCHNLVNLLFNIQW